MNDQAWLVPLRLDLPQFLQPDAVDLRVLALTQRKALLQLLAEIAAAALREQRVPGTQLHSRLIALRRLAVPADAEIPDDDAVHRPIVGVQHRGSSEPGIDLHAQRF